MRRFFSTFQPKTPITKIGATPSFYGATRNTSSAQEIMFSTAWRNSRRAKQWWSYSQHALSAVTACTLIYQTADLLSEDTFGLHTVAPFYEAKNGSAFRFKEFKSWEHLASEFAKSYAFCLPKLADDELNLQRKNAIHAIYALKTKDHVVFITFVNSLAQRSILKNHPSLFNQLVDICTRLSKADVLRELEKINPALTKLNNEAHALLTNPHADEIQQLTEQFITGPGSMKDDGADIFLQSMYYTELEDAHQDFLTTQLVNSNASNDETWTEQYLSYLRNLKVIHERYSHDQLGIITEFQYDGLKKSTEEQFCIFANKLKNKLQNGPSNSVEGIFLLAGAHFSCGQLRLEKDTDGQIKAKFAYLDGMGADWGQTNFKYHFLIQDIFDRKIDTFISEEQIQKARKGCSFIAAQQTYYLLHMPLYIKNGDLFSYLEKNTTGEVRLVETIESKIEKIAFAKTSRLPAALCIFRQACDDKHRHEDVIQHFDNTKLKVGSLFSAVYKQPEINDPNKGIIAPGRCGVLTDLEERSNEYNGGPSSPRSTNNSTLKDEIIANLGQQPNGKSANLGTEHFSFHTGISVVSPTLRKSLFSKQKKATSLDPKNSYILSELKK